MWAYCHVQLFKRLESNRESLLFMCSDCETFISADDLRINLWNIEVNDQSFNIVDIKPTNMEDLTGTASWFSVLRLTPLQRHHLYMHPVYSNVICCFLLISEDKWFGTSCQLAFKMRQVMIWGFCVGLGWAEVITSAEFHPNHCNILAYSSSKGSIRLIDMRQSALCDRHSKLYVPFFLLSMAWLLRTSFLYLSAPS